MAQRLSSLRVDGFRALNHLNIQRLADVNLLVGRNSTGKTTLLEAIQLVLSADIRLRLYAILTARDEFSFRPWQESGRLSVQDGPPLSFEALFHGRHNIDDEPYFEIRGGANEPTLSVRLVWLHVHRADDATVRYLESPGPREDPEAIPGFDITRDTTRTLMPLDRFTRMMTRRHLREGITSDVVFLPSAGMSPDEIGEVWDGIALTDDEDDVVEALRIVLPNLEKLVLVQSPASPAKRMLMAKISNFRSPVPFKSLGEGAVHLLSIALSMIRARGSTILIDEIASGVHYSVQGKLWELIFRQSALFNVQVFATTHSWDCVRALHEATRAYPQTSAALHRLEGRDDRMRVVSFDSDELAIIDIEEIEVR